MNLFDIIPYDVFKTLTSEYRKEYIDVLFIIYDIYIAEISYNIEREYIIEKLENIVNEVISYTL